MEPTAPPPVVLNCDDRPHPLQVEIARNFNQIASHTKSQWGLFNGTEDYEIANLDAIKTIQHIVQTSRGEEFWVVDVGAGNFQWIHHVADKLNAQKWPRKVTIHLVGVRGEKVANETPVQKGISIIHKLGNIRIEEIGKEFKRRKLSLTSKVDFITSRWCMRHLADPVGTFLQLLQLLRPQGLIATDGFYYSFTKDLKPTFWDEKMVSLLVDIGFPFLYLYVKKNTDASHFVIQRPPEQNPIIRMTYKNLGRIHTDHDIGLGCYVIFHPGPTPMIRDLPKNTKVHLGRGGLFETLQAANLFTGKAAYQELQKSRPPTPALPPPLPPPLPPLPQSQRNLIPRLPPRLPPPPRAIFVSPVPPLPAPTLISQPKVLPQPPNQGPATTPEAKRKKMLDDAV